MPGTVPSKMRTIMADVSCVGVRTKEKTDRNLHHLILHIYIYTLSSRGKCIYMNTEINQKYPVCNNTSARCTGRIRNIAVSLKSQCFIPILKANFYKQTSITSVWLVQSCPSYSQSDHFFSYCICRGNQLYFRDSSGNFQGAICQDIILQSVSTYQESAWT